MLYDRTTSRVSHAFKYYIFVSLYIIVKFFFYYYHYLILNVLKLNCTQYYYNTNQTALLQNSRLIRVRIHVPLPSSDLLENTKLVSVFFIWIRKGDYCELFLLTNKNIDAVIRYYRYNTYILYIILLLFYRSRETVCGLAIHLQQTGAIKTGYSFRLYF